MVQTKIVPVETPAVETAASYNYALGYLRGFLVLMVVAHHAALAYLPSAPPLAASLDGPARWWQAFPVLDPQRGAWAGLLTGFNDNFFMSLMFLLSGLFVWSGLKSKGPAGFLRGRLLRLGLPFVVATAILAPLAYYPAYLQMASHRGLGEFMRQWLALGVWPAGPAWFLWVLLVFDSVAALLFTLSRRWAETLGGFLAGPRSRPARFFALLVLGSALLYVPMELVFNGLAWSAWGPFTFQTARILHYFFYFAAGVGLGAWGIERGPLTTHGKLARRWPLWALTSVVLFLTMLTVAIIFMTQHLQSFGWRVSTGVLFAASCAASSFAFLALFLRFARSRSTVFGSLSKNSYGIYLVHYAFVNWLQLSMVGTTLPAFAKFTVVVTVAIAGSWLTSIALRRVPGVSKVV